MLLGAPPVEGWDLCPVPLNLDRPCDCFHLKSIAEMMLCGAVGLLMLEHKIITHFYLIFSNIFKEMQDVHNLGTHHHRGLLNTIC